MARCGRRAGLPLVLYALLTVSLPSQAEDPPVPVETPAEQASADAVRVALVDSGVNYELDLIRAHLARDAEGRLIGHDYWDMDDRPYDAHPVAQGGVQRHGTRTASVLLREAPFVSLVPYRYPRPDMSRMRQLIEHAADNGVRIIGLPLGGNLAEEWTAFADAAREHAEILFIASAGNNGRDIDRQPVYPASLDLPNLLVVSSADDFVRPAAGVNWGRSSVDYLVPAEFLEVIRFDGSRMLASGSSYAVPRVAALAARILRDNPHSSVADMLSAIRTRFANGLQPRHVRLGYLYDPQFDARDRIDIRDVSTLSLPAPEQIQARLPLDVLLLDERWTVEEAQRVLGRAQAILGECGLHLDDVRLRRVQAPQYLRDLETGASRTLLQAVREPVPDRRVLVVFARDTRMNTRFDAEAFGQSNTRSRDWLRHSVWLTLALQDRGIALAHELVHVLANSGVHVQTAENLMLARTTGDNTRLSAEQCRETRSTALQAGLLH